MVGVHRTAVAIITGVLAAGCGAGNEPGPATNDPPVAVASSPSAATPSAGPSPPAGSPWPTRAPAPQALRFSATTVDGAVFDAATLAGKPVVLWFWAAWCPRCRAAAGDVADVHRDFTGRVTVVGVAGLNSGGEAMRQFVADRGIGGFVNLADDEGVVWRRFEVTTQEYYVLVDAAGRVVHKGPLSAQALRERVAALAG